jgi:hypothetical protein
MFTVFFALILGSSCYRALTKPLDVGFDELAHASYVAQIQEANTSVDLESLKILDSKSMEFSQTSNYLNHPPTYYRLMAWTGPRLLGNHKALIAHRLLNLFIVLMGVALLFQIPLEGNWNKLESYNFGLSIVTIPVLAPLAGSINNDNLAFLGGAVSIYATTKLAKTFEARWLSLMCLGVLIASAAKLTGLMLIGTYSVLVVALLRTPKEVKAGAVLIVLATILVAGVPYIEFTMQYGSPTPDTLAQHTMLVDGATKVGWGSHRLGFFQYVIDFVTNFFINWMPTLGPRSLTNLSAMVLPIIVVAAAIAGASRIGGLRDRHDPRQIIALSGLAAMAVTFAVHVAFSYQRHLQTGWMLDAWPRYYLPLAVAVPIGCLVFASTLPHAWRKRALYFFLVEPILFITLATPVGLT